MIQLTDKEISELRTKAEQKHIPALIDEIIRLRNELAEEIKKASTCDALQARVEKLEKAIRKNSDPCGFQNESFYCVRGQQYRIRPRYMVDDPTGKKCPACKGTNMSKWAREALGE